MTKIQSLKYIFKSFPLWKGKPLEETFWKINLILSQLKHSKLNQPLSNNLGQISLHFAVPSLVCTVSKSDLRNQCQIDLKVSPKKRNFRWIQWQVLLKLDSHKFEKKEKKTRKDFDKNLQWTGAKDLGQCQIKGKYISK